MKFIQILILIFLCSCGNNEKVYPAVGVIHEVIEDKREMIIHHDEIPGFMMAMTMTLKVDESVKMGNWERGDSINFDIVIAGNNGFVRSFESLGKVEIPEQEDDFWEDEDSPTKLGEILPDATFLDLDSNVVSLSKNNGNCRFISFVFSRCPMPNMCPAVVVKNQYLSKAFQDIPEIEFLLVSFDYLYDTPSILKLNYGSLISSNPNLKAYSSYGHINDIFTLSGQSQVSFWGIEENDIGHSLRSVLIDPERRLMKAFDGLDWRPELVERKIKNILKAYSF